MPEPNLLNGKEVAEQIAIQLREKIAELSITPTLAIIQVGHQDDSSTYIRLKAKYAEAVGVKTIHVQLERETTEDEIKLTILDLNADPTIHGIILQLPLNSAHSLDQTALINLISPQKDVDGLTATNAGLLAQGRLHLSPHIPPTPLGVLELVKRTAVPISGAHAVVIGRSAIVGAPMGALLLWNDATVTQIHSKSTNLKELCQQADILVVAAGQPRLVQKDWIKQGAIVIDVGINSVEDSTRKSGWRLVGDVDYEAVKEVAGWITPVPGGVGPMTVAMLISNTVDAAKKSIGK